jgi:hypothetical protein
VRLDRRSASGLRWILSHHAVDRLAEEIGVADVAGVLVVQIDHRPPEVGRFPVAEYELRGLSSPPVARAAASAVRERSTAASQRA